MVCMMPCGGVESQQQSNHDIGWGRLGLSNGKRGLNLEMIVATSAAAQGHEPWHGRASRNTKGRRPQPTRPLEDCKRREEIRYLDVIEASC
jgi:hypothetical protein